ncbi:MAG TPA: G1 family glutamic endopeptidase [Acidimicrobiales bacterium]|nr:G1 family glutamic endopeptidase [Acidimicrobiales bacterium]
MLAGLGVAIAGSPTMAAAVPSGIATASPVTTWGGAPAMVPSTVRTPHFPGTSGVRPGGTSGQGTPQAVGWASANWSGYALTGHHIASVGGQWNVPAIVPSQSPTYSATWVGIDGYDNGSLIQAGTEQDSANGSNHFTAWWTTAAQNFTEQQIPLSVAVGDTMKVEIAEHGSAWEVDATDAGYWSYSVWITGFSTPGDSAEWIMEAPCVNGRTATLSTYTPITFDDATVDGGSPGLVSSEAGQLYQGPNAVSTPSSPDGDGDGFTLAYGFLAPPAPVS